MVRLFNINPLIIESITVNCGAPLHVSVISVKIVPLTIQLYPAFCCCAALGKIVCAMIILKPGISHHLAVLANIIPVEGVSIGTIECGVVSTGPLPNFVQDFMVLDLPYLIKDRTKAFQIMDGEIGQSMLDKLDTIGIKGMSFWDNGYRYITSSRPVVHPEDVKGMKIRTMENEVHMNTFKLLGATPTPMAISEFLTAVRQGTVDGHENVMVSIDMNKVYEVNPCISLTKHFYSAAPFLVNADFYQSLPDDIRQAFDRAEKEAMEWERQYCDELDNELIEKMKGLGAEFYEVDIDEWARATQGVYDLYEDKIDQALIDAFRNED